MQFLYAVTAAGSGEKIKLRTTECATTLNEHTDKVQLANLNMNMFIILSHKGLVC